jgi:hypothetical protein
VIIFGSVQFLLKKITKPKLFFLKKNPKLGQTDRFRFGSVQFFRAKTGSNRFGSVFPVWLGFGSVFFWFFVGFGSVRFFVYKTETEPNRPVFSKI